MKNLFLALLCTLGMATTLAAADTVATSPDPDKATATYSLDWFSVDGGGGPSTGTDGTSTFQVNGNIGQPDPGNPSGGGFEIRGGSWTASAVLLSRSDFEDGTFSYWTVEAP